MLPIIGPLISAAASIGGALLGNSANAREAQKNRDFQERMSNTAHRREVADLMNAGINPAQTGNAGGGASTPGGAVASMSANPLEGGISNARETARAQTELKIAREQNEQDKAVKTAQATTIRTQSGLNIAQNKKAYKEAEVAEAQKQFIQTQERVMKAMQPGQLQAQSLENIMTGLQIPGALNDAQIEQFLGPKGKAAVRSLAGIGATAATIAKLRQGGRALDLSEEATRLTRHRDIQNARPTTTKTTRTYDKGRMESTSTTSKEP